MDAPLNDSLFGSASLEAPAALASALAPPAHAGHFDELRGVATPLTAPRTSPSVQAATPLHDAALAPPVPQAEAPSSTTRPPLTPGWSQFFDQLGSNGFEDLPRRAVSLARQIRDNGVTYNVYADGDGPQRPWSLDLFPLMISPES